jgi:hypothetical protein
MSGYAPTVGFGLSQPPIATLATMDAITLKAVQPFIADNILIPSPTLWRMTRAKGRTPKVQGGAIVTPIGFTTVPNGGPYWGGMMLTTTVPDPIQPSEQQWRNYRQPITVAYTDILANMGNASGLDYVKSIFQMASGTFVQILSQALWGVSPYNSSLDIDSIPGWVGSTTNTIAGINRSLTANAFWRPQLPLAGTSNSTALTPALAMTAYWNTVYGVDEPDYMTMNQASYAGFVNNFIPNIRYFNEFADEEAVQAGFASNFRFNKCVVMMDRWAPANNAWILNTKYLYPIFLQYDFFKVHPWIMATQQLVYTSYITSTLQLSCIQPRTQININTIQ